MNMKIKISLLTLLLVSACSLSPGMHMNTKSSNVGEFVNIKSIEKRIKIEDVSNVKNNNHLTNGYKIGNGDQIYITVWGLPDIFPPVSSNSDLVTRRVDSNGNIYFPYVGLIKASQKTESELRNELTNNFSEFFNDPQLDVSIVKFNSQKVFILGEVTTPMKINLTDVPLSLNDAIGQARGINTNTANGSEVFIIRQGTGNDDPKIFRADLSSPKGFLDSGNFYLSNNDIIYVNARGTTRWNKVISQFFPFSTFLNSVDNLVNND